VSAPSIELPPVEISFKQRVAVSRVSAVVTRGALAFPIAGGVIAILAFLYVALTRMTYPYELEWLESGILEHANRLADGHGLYGAPGAEFTQLPYAPLTFVLGAAITVVTGAHFWVLRLISIVSILAAFWLIYRLVKRETLSAASGFIAAGIFAATFHAAGNWFDVAKPDSLFVALTIAGVYTARHATTWKTAVGAAVVMTLAVFAKQTAVFALAPIGLYLLATKWRVGVAYLATAGVLIGSITLIANTVTHGWYDFFTWELLFQHEILEQNKKLFFTHDMQPFWPVALLILAAAPRLLKRENLWMTGFYSVAVIGLFAGAFSSRLHSGGAENVLMPAFAATAIGAGLSLGFILQAPKRIAVVVGACALCVMQFAFMRYTPGDQIPSNADRMAGDQFVGWLKTIPGDVWVVDHPGYAILAGKTSFAGEGGMEDVLRGKTPHAKAALENSIAQNIHDQHFSAIILDGSQDARGFPADWKQYYEQMPGSAMPSDKGHPIVNGTGIPRDVWVPIGTQVPMPVQNNQ
jgi:hypothetical protein